jgi:hypothetical protein
VNCLLTIVVLTKDAGFVSSKSRDASDPTLVEWCAVSATEDLLPGVKAGAGRFVSFIEEPALRLADGLIRIARRLQEAGGDLAVGAGRCNRRTARMLRTEGVRSLDPAGLCPLVFRRAEAAAALVSPCVSAAGDHWLWALTSAMTRRGRLLVIDDEPAMPSWRRRGLPYVKTATLDAVARASAPAASQPQILVVGRIDASVSLYFDGLSESVRSMLRYREPGTLLENPEPLFHADAIVLVRDLQRPSLSGLLDTIAALKIPSAYFADDSFPTLRREEKSWWFYEPWRVARLMTSFDEVWVSTRALQDEFRTTHVESTIFGLVFDEQFMTPLRSSGTGAAGVRVAVPGRPFRSSDFQANAWPALVDLAKSRRVEVITHAGFPMANTSGPEVRRILWEPSFAQFIRGWQATEPAVLLHPRSCTQNARFKTPNALLVACYLGAVPVIAEGEPAYDGVGEAEGVLRADSPAVWLAAVEQALIPGERERLLDALQRFCRARFTSSQQGSLLMKLATIRPVVEPAEADRRAAIVAKKTRSAMARVVGYAGKRVILQVADRLRFSAARV